MNQKAIRRVFNEVIEAYRDSATSNIAEYATSREAEDAAVKMLDRKIKGWRKRIERLTERTQASD